MTLAEFKTAIASQPCPAPGLSPELQALWLCQRGEWEAAHNIAQQIHTPLGSWIHALLHLIEGDLGNSGYWYRLANKPPRRKEEIDAEWDRIAAAALEAA